MPEAIGKVETLEGEVTVTRADGSQERLGVGDPVFQGDEIVTGNGSLGVTLADQTAFSMTATSEVRAADGSMPLKKRGVGGKV